MVKVALVTGINDQGEYCLTEFFLEKKYEIHVIIKCLNII